MRVVGLDVGGANLKGCGLSLDESATPHDISYSSAHFPVWLRDRTELWSLLSRTTSNLSSGETPDLVSLVMTAELSDTFATKREGVTTIACGASTVLSDARIVFPSVDLKLLQLSQVLASPLSVAAANWPVLAWTIGLEVPECILVDVGSTTTDVIPIRNGLPTTAGKDDTSRLIHGELVYTGALRTDVSAILRAVTVDGRLCRLSSEYFATSGDVHLVLGHVTEDMYATETADGRGKTQKECLARLARVICGDIETVQEDLIVDIAQQAWEQQLDDIRNAIDQVCTTMSVKPEDETFVLAGLGAQFLGKEAVNRTGARAIRTLDEVLGVEGSIAATAYSAALYAGVNWRDFL
ncbi:MAG: hypothetical protein JSW05_13010 [Candidatus Thorarchaeota archaeon]|nr:MAG: hypothetical protein JSW05_13010 [Candidatus Thorarchaeota archaeon]